jgi:phage repressor protein C with HTH and peptisase S24 domain
VSIDDLIGVDIEFNKQNVHLIEKKADVKKGLNVHPNVHPSVHLRGKKEAYSNEFTISIVAEDAAQYGAKVAAIPVTDISVAAGGGIYNEGHIETSKAVHLPSMFVKPGHTYLCVKIKGESMAPTLQDGGYVVIRLLDKSEWAKMPDERIFVVIDSDSKAYLKRVKNRFKQGLIILRSDTPDKVNYPNFNLEENEIVAIWYVEWYFSAKMPNIHDQYYSRLQQLEDKVELMAVNLTKK